MLVPVPCVGGAEEARLRADLGLAGIDQRHDIVDVDPPDVLALFAAHDLRIVSMGRPAADDPVMFLAAAAAGTVAAAAHPVAPERAPGAASDELSGSNGSSTSPRRCSRRGDP